MGGQSDALLRPQAKAVERRLALRGRLTLSKARLRRVSGRTRPAWALLVLGSRPVWHTVRADSLTTAVPCSRSTSAGSKVVTGSPSTGGDLEMEMRSPGSSASLDRAVHLPCRSTCLGLGLG